MLPMLDEVPAGSPISGPSPPHATRQTFLPLLGCLPPHATQWQIEEWLACRLRFGQVANNAAVAITWLATGTLTT